MMANLRPVLLMTLVFLGYLLWVEWQRDYGPRSTASAVETFDSASVPGDADAFSTADPALPSTDDAPASGADLPSAPTAAATPSR